MEPARSVMIVVVLAGASALGCASKGDKGGGGGEGSPLPPLSKPAATLGEPPARVETGLCEVGQARFESGPRPLRHGERAFGASTGWGTIGTGSYGTIGHGSGAGTGYGVGGGRGGLAAGAKLPRTRIDTATVTGNLDRNIVRRYVRQSLPKIQYCYEKRLLLQPGLAGTLEVSFTIDEGGKVTKAESSGLDAEVGRCVAGTIESISFPKPTGGGTVEVSYQFSFESGGGSPASKPEAKPGDGGDGTAMTLDEGKMGKRPSAPQPAREVRLFGSERAIGDCLAKQQAAWGVGVLELRMEKGQVVEAKAIGVDGEEASRCLAEHARELALRVGESNETMRCGFAWGEMPEEERLVVDIDEKSVRFAGKALGDVAALAADESPEWKVVGLYDELRARREAREANPDPDVVHVVGPLVLRPVGSTSARVLFRVLNTLHGSQAPVVLAARDGGTWRLLHDVRFPVVPVAIGTGAMWGGKPVAREGDVPAEEPMMLELSVMVSEDSVWVGDTTGDRRQIKHKDGAIDVAALEKTLGELRTARFADRRDAEISVEDPVTYVMLVPVIDVAAKVGFVDWVLVEPQALTVRFKQ